MKSNILKELKSGLFYTSIFRYANYFINLFISAFLARILLPEDFGVVAMISIFLTFFYLISNFGFGPGIIQCQDLNERDNYSLFIFTLIISLPIIVIFFFSGPLLSSFYNNQEYNEIIKLLSISLFFHTLNMVPYNLLVKNRKFKELGIRSLIISITSGILAILLANYGFSYYSLIYKSIFEAILTFIINFKMSKIKFFKSISFQPVKKIFSFSFYQFLFNINSFLTNNLDTLLIGKFLGPSRLGYYDRAYRLSSTFSSLTLVFSSVLHPVLATYQKDKDLIAFVYIKLFKILLIIGLPLAIFLSFCSEEIIIILYSDKWVNSIPVFKYLAFLVFANIIISSSISIFQVLEAIRILFFFGVLNLILMIISILIGIKINNSIISVAFYITVSNIIITILMSIFIFKGLLKLRFGNLFNELKYGLLISIIIFIENYILQLFLTINNVYFSLVLKSSMNLILFFIIIKYFKMDNELLKLFRK